jgi:CheY-like chemotaxis protein
MRSAPPTILVAEDEPLAAEAIGELLALYGFRVLLAEDGQAALEIAASRRFDALLTDLRMPRVDGQELIARLRGDAPQLPVVVMTGFAPPGGAAVLQRGSGPLLLLDKPLEPTRLVAALREVLGRAA